MASWITDDKPSSGSATGLVADAINDGTTTVAPSQNAVFDALALKAPLASPGLTGVPTAPTAAPGTNTTQVATTAFVAAGVASLVALAQTVNAQTGTTYTLVTADAGKLVTLNNGSAITLTVPQDSDATIAVGTYIDLYQLGAGQVTVAAGTGATLRTSGLTAKARAQYARLGVQKVAADTWSLFGDLAAS
jgi:hypothetical protein